MRKQMIAVAALLGMALMGSGRAHAQSGGTAANLTPADHSEIQHILTSLNQGADFNDSDLWVSSGLPTAPGPVPMESRSSGTIGSGSTGARHASRAGARAAGGTGRTASCSRQRLMARPGALTTCC